MLLASPITAYAADATSIAWFSLLLGLFGGLALFLAGLEQLSEGLKKAAGEALKNMLSKLTTNRVMGAITGAIVTGVLNSSSVTTVLVVGFITAGVMSLQQSVGVIMGANIGSTVTAQILAFNISKYALLPVAGGFFMLFVSKKDLVRNWGMMIMGLGMVFFGMSIMSEAMYPLRSYQPFLDLLQRMENPLLGILAGAIFTGLVQSSAATVGIAIAMASGGILSLHAGIALALGANIGTCVTALMAAMGKPPEAVRAAMVHVTFNIVGVIIWLPFIAKLALLAEMVSPLSPDLDGAARIAAEVPRQIANANTIFNVINTLLFLPFTAFFAVLVNKIIRERPEPEAVIAPLYLESSLLDVPSMALQGVRRELARIAGLTVAMLNSYRDAITQADFEGLRGLVKEDDKIDILEQASMEYLGQIRSRSLSEKESSEHQCLMASAVALETLADVIETDLVELADRSLAIKYTRSPKSRELLRKIYLEVSQSIELLVPILEDSDIESARRIIDQKSTISQLIETFILRKSERLGQGTPDAIRIARLEVSSTDKLQRMYSLCRRVAKAHLKEKSATD